MATSSSKKRRSEPEEEYDEEVGVQSAVPSMGMTSLINTPGWFDFVLKVMNMDTEIDTEALTADFEEEYVKRRKGDFGKMLDYVPAKYIRQRLNEVLSGKWSFFPMADQMVKDPNPTWSKQEEEYIDSPRYIKVLGVLVIPGLGVQAQYGVKKTMGFGEANDWKAAATDAFKKCAAAFGVEADYEIEDDDDSAPEDVDLDDVEYDDDELEDALATEVSFGKYKDLTVGEILDEDPDYLEWIAGNAREKDLRRAAAVALKSAESEKKSRSSKKKQSSARNSKKSASAAKSTSKKPAAKKKPEPEDDVDDEAAELISQIEEIFEESDDYDTVTIKELIKSISTSKRNPKGKRKLEELSVKELNSLISVLTEDEDDDEDEE